MINFQEFPWQSPIYSDKICLKDILFFSKSVNNLTPSVLIHGLFFPRINITMKLQGNVT